MRSIEGMSVLVTGGGSGIGEGIARHFAAHGAKVTISGRRPEKVEAVAGEIGVACRAVIGDVTSPADRAAMVAIVRSGMEGVAMPAANTIRNVTRRTIPIRSSLAGASRTLIISTYLTPSGCSQSGDSLVLVIAGQTNHSKGQARTAAGSCARSAGAR